MKCANCGFENIDGAKFCQKCGLRITTSATAKGVAGTDRTPNHSASATLTRCPKCGTERCGDGIYCTRCDYTFSSTFSSLNPDVSSIPTLVHHLTLRPELPTSPLQEKEIRRIASAMERNAKATERIFILMLVWTIIGFLSGIAVLIAVLDILHDLA